MSEIVARAPFEPPVAGATLLDPQLEAGGAPAALDALPGRPRWLRQVHGADVIDLDAWHEGAVADAAWTDRPGEVVVVRTADCLPILVAEPRGACVAAIHAGWRGLAAGVVAATLARLPVPAARLRAWIGPRICADCYEVGDDVRAALAAHAGAFAPGRPGRWQADLPAIATEQLRGAGVRTVADCALCTAGDPRLCSARRDGRPGRMATAAWIAPAGR
jgi:hypothetical protein